MFYSSYKAINTDVNKRASKKKIFLSGVSPQRLLNEFEMTASSSDVFGVAVDVYNWFGKYYELIFLVVGAKRKICAVNGKAQLVTKKMV